MPHKTVIVKTRSGDSIEVKGCITGDHITRALRGSSVEVSVEGHFLAVKRTRTRVDKGQFPQE